jgi:hypothetical protein
VSALIVANNLLECVLGEVYAKASRGFLRGRRVRPLRAKTRRSLNVGF